jgi:enoyl-CoA hydratase
MNYENILVDTENSVATITINRPTKLNALNRKTIEELHQAFENLEKKQRNSSLFNWSGEKSFVAGADIAEFTISS